MVTVVLRTPVEKQSESAWSRCLNITTIIIMAGAHDGFMTCAAVICDMGLYSRN